MKKAFTLIELIVVIAIIAILAAVIAPNAFNAIEKAKISKAVADFKTIKTASNILYTDTGKWPHAGLSENKIVGSHLLQNPTIWDGATEDWNGWDGPYLESAQWIHPWGGEYALATNMPMTQRPTNFIYPIVVEFEDSCFPNGPNEKCAVVEESGKKIDTLIDDGDLDNGGFRKSPGQYTDYHWALVWEICRSGDKGCW